MFVLALETVIEPDYVTECLCQLWNLHVVPIYWGAPNVDNYMPARNSLIDVTDFHSPKILGQYLEYLRYRYDKYDKFFEWHGKPMSPQFERSIRNSAHHALCNLCKYITTKY